VSWAYLGRSLTGKTGGRFSAGMVLSSSANLATLPGIKAQVKEWEEQDGKKRFL